MKKIYILFLVILTTSCGKFSNDGNVFESEKLIGKYKVDITPFIEDATKSSIEDDGSDKLANGLAKLMFASMEVEMNFYKNNKGIMSIDGGVVDFASAFSDEKLEKVHEFNYKVENDSILYTKGTEDKEYNKWAIIRKFSENYDFLQFLIIEDGKEKVFFNLKKVNE